MRTCISKRVATALAILAALPAASAAGNHRIVVLSDTHVMVPAQVEKDGTAWQQVLKNDRKMLDLSRPLFDSAMARIEAIRPEMVLITGDLTKDGERINHEYVARQLTRLRLQGIKTYVIPGNHDCGTENAVAYVGDHTRPMPTLSREGFASLYAECGYQESRRDTASLSYALEPFKGLTLIGVDSGQGRLAPATIAWICQQARDAQRRGHRVVAMMHHALMEHFTYEKAFINSSVVDRWQDIRDSMLAAGIHVVFTGHFHTSDIAMDYAADKNRKIYDVSTGSLISFPCDMRIVEINDSLTRMTITTESITQLAGHNDFPAEAEARLHSRTEKLAEGLISRKAGGLAEELHQNISLWATALADAFILNAKGNEWQFSPKSIMERLQVPFHIMPRSETCMRSLLEDAVPYGTSHQNVTDDRTLVITAF